MRGDKMLYQILEKDQKEANSILERKWAQRELSREGA